MKSKAIFSAIRMIAVPLLIAAFLLAAVPIPVSAGETYGLCVGNLMIDNYICDDIVSALANEDCSVSGSARFDSSTNTLYLTNFQYAGMGYAKDGVRAAIYCFGDLAELNIVVSGTCGISLTGYVDETSGCGLYFPGDVLTISGESLEDVLLLTGASNDYREPDHMVYLADSYGVRVPSGDLVVDSCSLCANGAEAISSTGLLVSGNLTLQNGAELNAFGNLATDGSSTGVAAPGYVSVEEGSSLYCESYGAFASSNGYFGGTLECNGLVYAKSGDNAYFSGIASAIDCQVLCGEGGTITAVGSAGGPGASSTGIEADVIELTDCTVSANGGSAEGADSQGIYADEIILDGCSVTATGGEALESIGISTDVLALQGSSAVLAQGGSGYNLSCGLQIRQSGDPVIGKDSELCAFAGESEDGDSIGVIVKGSTLTLPTDNSGSLEAGGDTKAVGRLNGSYYDSVTVRGGYVRYCGDIPPEYPLVPGHACMGAEEEGYMWVTSYMPYVYVRGDSTLGITVTAEANLETGGVYGIVTADDDTATVWLIVASYDKSGKLLEMRSFYYGDGGLYVDENGDDYYGPDPLFIGPNYFSFSEVATDPQGSVSVFVLAGRTYIPLSGPGEVTYESGPVPLEPI